MEYIFWAFNPNYGEPDLIFIFKNHIHGNEDFLLAVEAKFKSGKSGTDENDQLVRYFEAINQDNESFLEEAISGFSGKKGYIVYLTESEAFSDISASLNILQGKYPEIKENVFHLRWHQLYVTFEKMGQYYSSYEKSIVEDMKLYLEKVGLRDFSGISLPDETLSAAFLSPFPVFYDDGTLKRDKKAYFDQFMELDLEYEKNIFFGGN